MYGRDPVIVRMPSVDPTPSRRVGCANLRGWPLRRLWCATVATWARGLCRRSLCPCPG